jgi:phosphoserine aminotransferase
MGVEHHGVPDSKGITLVCDMSSNFCSRPIDFSKFGCIYAGAQKNAGPAGVTIILIRQDLLLLNKPNTIPTVMDYKITSDNDSMYNTPPCWNIYICGLFFKYMI